MFLLYFHKTNRAYPISGALTILTVSPPHKKKVFGMILNCI